MATTAAGWAKALRSRSIGRHMWISTHYLTLPNNQQISLAVPVRTQGRKAVPLIIIATIIAISAISTVRVQCPFILVEPHSRCQAVDWNENLMDAVKDRTLAWRVKPAMDLSSALIIAPPRTNLILHHCYPIQPVVTPWTGSLPESHHEPNDGPRTC